MKEMLLALLLLIIGFVLLIKGADFFVDGSSSVAKRLKVPSMIIGLTIVAMGTSLPECAVSVTASLNNNNALAVSNVIGSNIFNLMVVCGVCALFTPCCPEIYKHWLIRLKYLLFKCCFCNVNNLHNYLLSFFFSISI
jgi:cation:H+ antiporter